MAGATRSDESGPPTLSARQRVGAVLVPDVPKPTSREWRHPDGGTGLLVLVGNAYARHGMTQVLVAEDGGVQLWTVSRAGLVRDELRVAEADACAIVEAARRIVRNPQILREGRVSALPCEQTYLFMLLDAGAIVGGFSRFAREIQATDDLRSLLTSVRNLSGMVSARRHVI